MRKKKGTLRDLLKEQSSRSKKKPVKKAAGPKAKLHAGRFAAVLTLKLEPMYKKELDLLQASFGRKQYTDTLRDIIIKFSGLQKQIQDLKAELHKTKGASYQQSNLIMELKQVFTRLEKFKLTDLDLGTDPDDDDEEDQYN